MNFSVIKMEKGGCTIREVNSQKELFVCWELMKRLKPTDSKYLYEFPDFTGNEKDDLTKILPIYYKARNNPDDFKGALRLLGIIVKKFMDEYLLNQNDFISLFDSFVQEKVFVGEK